MSGLVLTLPPPAGEGTPGGGGEIAPGNAGEIAVYASSGTGVQTSGSTIADVVSTASIIPPSTPAQNSFLVSGGAIVWTAAYNFRIGAASYYINGVALTSAEQMVTLGAAHATLDRIDVIAVNDAGAVEVVPGTAAAQPSEPDVDPATQLKLGVILVTAASVAPAGASVTNMWLEQAGQPTEWDWTASGSGFTIGSSSNPRTGTKSLEGTNVPKFSYLQAALGAGAFVDPNAYDSLVLYVRSKALWASNRALKLQWHSSGTPKGMGLNLQHGVFGFDSNIITGYQLVAIPMVQFAVPAGTPCNQLRLTDTNGAIGFFLDDISLQQGIPTELKVTALTQAQADARYAPLPRVRKVGVNVDGSTGVKGSVQVDFTGTIIGWSIEADVAGSISVEVSKRSGTQILPQVPDPVTHKISASAPIALSSEQAKGVAATGVLTWTNTAVALWDSIQFNVTSVTTITRAALYLRIQRTEMFAAALRAERAHPFLRALKYDPKQRRDAHGRWTEGGGPAVVVDGDPIGLAAEARKAGSFEQFEKDFTLNIKHGLYWHLTDNPDFALDVAKGPRDMSSMGGGDMTAGALMVTSHLENWDEYYNVDPQTDEPRVTRPYVAMVDLSGVPRESYKQISRGFGNEFFVPDSSKAKVLGVVPIKTALALDEKHLAALPQSQEELRAFYDRVTKAKKFDPNQPRGKGGRWVKVGERIAEFKAKYPEAAKQYPRSSHTEMGSIESHTKDVGREWEKQLTHEELAGISERFGGDVEKVMASAIALHDIGKAEAIEEGEGKHAQHEHTIPIMQTVPRQEGFSEKDVTLVTELLNHDLIGPLFRGYEGFKAKEAGVVAELKDKAKTVGMDVADFVTLQLAFYQADASAYPYITQYMRQEPSGKWTFEGNKKIAAIEALKVRKVDREFVNVLRWDEALHPRDAAGKFSETRGDRSPHEQKRRDFMVISKRHEREHVILDRMRAEMAVKWKAWSEDLGKGRKKPLKADGAAAKKLPSYKEAKALEEAFHARYQVATHKQRKLEAEAKEILKVPVADRSDVEFVDDKQMPITNPLRKKHAQQILAKLRQFDGSGALVSSRFTAEQVEQIKKLGQSYSDVFLGAIRENPDGSFSLPSTLRLSEAPTPRAFADGMGIYLGSGRELENTVNHEVAHHIEVRSSAARDAAIALREKLANQPREVYKLKTVSPALDDTEEALRGNFPDPYSAKLYPKDGATEMISTGVESYMADPLTFARTRPEHFNLIFDIMHGKYRT